MELFGALLGVRRFKAHAAPVIATTTQAVKTIAPVPGLKIVLVTETVQNADPTSEQQEAPR